MVPCVSCWVGVEEGLMSLLRDRVVKRLRLLRRGGLCFEVVRMCLLGWRLETGNGIAYFVMQFAARSVHRICRSTSSTLLNRLSNMNRLELKGGDTYDYISCIAEMLY